MEIAKNYNPAEVESKWYAYWLENKFFHSEPNPDKEAYTVVIPPPNVTGVLHMGHMLNNTIQDVLVRRARMQGKEACWVPGTDHASIATEAKVVAMLQEQGIEKKELSREEFLAHAWNWKEKYGGIILEQLKKLGCSCDWDRTRFTMEPDLYEAVVEVFVDLYNKGLIYRGIRMVNWDPAGRTALSDEEVYHKEVQSKLYYVRYPIEGSSDEYITIATTRPETIMADTGVCVNPNDERYKHLIGKKAIVPIVNKAVPIIADEYVDPEFGTGCLKVTPAHDINDYNLGLKHKLPVIDLFNEDGTMNEYSVKYEGMDRFAVRKLVPLELEAQGLLVKVEEISNKIGLSERTHAVVEPRISQQWFLKMGDMAKPALDNVMNDHIRLHPAKFKNMYRHWMENVHDWCISRQLWWGQQIPAFYMLDGTCIVAKNKKAALRIARDKYQLFALSETDLTQDDDVLDTWFSSWLWPISVFDGFKDPNNADINYYYPTNDLVTAPEILFFWVARMIMAGYEYRGELPFKNVYLTGIVRDKQGRKMSKSLGNSPNPLELIEKYSADGVRTGMLFSSPAGNDLPFDESLCLQGRNFCNKLWNAFRLVKGWELSQDAQSEVDKLAISWMEERLNQVVAELDADFAEFRISDALLRTYKFVWDEFCAWYLELVKPEFGQPISAATFQSVVAHFDAILRMLHPFMPFISEEIWQEMESRNEGESICLAPWPTPAPFNNATIEEMNLVFECISQIRNFRNTQQISPKEALQVGVASASTAFFSRYQPALFKLANLAGLDLASQVDTLPEVWKTNKSHRFALKQHEVFILLPADKQAGPDKDTLLQELEYQKGFLESVMKKLGNERFVANAKPDVIANEQRKKEDSEAKIRSLEEALKNA